MIKIKSSTLAVIFLYKYMIHYHEYLNIIINISWLMQTMNHEYQLIHFEEHDRLLEV